MPITAATRRRKPRKQRITEHTVRTAKPQADTSYLIWDTKALHLALRIQPTGRKSWYVNYSRHARPRWLRLGDATITGLAEARTRTHEVMLAVARGKDPAAEKKAERGAGTFAELAESYLQQHAKRHNRSWPQADALIRRHVLPRWSKLQAININRGDVKAMMVRIEGPIAANQTLAAVSAIFSWAVDEKIVADNPCRGIARNATKSRERVLGKSEVPKFWQAFADAGVEGAALRMILLTGQRPGEVAHMRREHIKDGWWEMSGGPIADVWHGTKNGATHRVWIPQPALALIGKSDATTGYVFAGVRGGPITGLDGAMRAICKQLGVERATPHDLRRTHGSTVTGLKFGRDAMNRIQNHKEGGIASVYDRHEYADENRTVMEAVAAHLVALAEGRSGGNVVRLVAS